MTKKTILWICVCGVALAVILTHIFGLLKSERVPFEEGVYYKVGHVIDGDTFTVYTDSSEFTVRMLGINTPETVDPRKAPQCFGIEASSETKRILSDESVRLSLNRNREAQDKYGRYLAYVYTDKNVLVNAHLISEGFAREYTYGKAHDRQREFRQLEAAARKQEKGLWGNCSDS